MTEFVLGGGCFWCTEAIFRRLKGVHTVESGYAGGSIPNPSYEQVTTGQTGHAEVVKVVFNEAIIPAKTLLQIFFTIHNPTTPNRQGADYGPQYRSIMLYTSPEQETVFEAARHDAQRIWDNPIVTEIVPLDMFYLAESYHQRYYEKNPQAGYCSIVIAPKVVKARQQFAQWLQDDA